MKQILLQAGLGKEASTEIKCPAAEGHEYLFEVEGDDEGGQELAGSNTRENIWLEIAEEHIPLLHAIQEEHSTFEAVQIAMFCFNASCDFPLKSPSEAFCLFNSFLRRSRSA